MHNKAAAKPSRIYRGSTGSQHHKAHQILDHSELYPSIPRSKTMSEPTKQKDVVTEPEPKKPSKTEKKPKGVDLSANSRGTSFPSP
jgi:hypothetical protein